MLHLNRKDDERMKRTIAAILCTAFLALGTGAPGAFAEDKTIAFDPLWDSLALGGGLGSAALTKIGLNSSQGAFVQPDAASLWAIDCGVRFPYSAGLDKASLAVEGGAFLWPAFFGVLGEKSEWLPAAASYAEAMCYAYAAKNVIKYLVPKERPYSYYGAAGLDQSQLEEYRESFPSGHATLAFCAATSFAVLAGELAPEKPATPWLIAGGYGLAVGEAILRVASGNHFPSDVVAGALLGSGVGFLVTELHLRSSSGKAGESGAGRALSLGGAAGPGLIVTLSY
jgi:membrane-associated phospholipid phosphatase